MCYDHPYDLRNYNQFIFQLETYKSQIIKLISENETLKKESTNFVSVKDKLPKDGQECIVIGRRYDSNCYGIIGRSKFNSNTGWEGDCSFVTLWQPISEGIKTMIKSANL